VQLGFGESVRRAGPLAVRLDEEGPVGLALWEALAVLLGLVIDLADSFARAQLVGPILNT